MVVGAQHALVAAVASVHHLGFAEEAIDRLGDEAAVESIARPLDAGLAVGRRLRLADHLLPGLRKNRVAKQGEIGRAPCRDSVCQSVSILVVAVLLKKKYITKTHPHIHYIKNKI